MVTLSLTASTTCGRWLKFYGQVDAQSIITHEVGHQLRPDHSPYQDATMYAAYLLGATARGRSLMTTSPGSVLYTLRAHKRIA